MAEATHRPTQIVETALALLEESGPDAVTMRAIADRIGIRAPSLYKHFSDKNALETAMIAEGFRDQAQEFHAAITDAPDPIAGLAAVYRRWALDHPHLYRLMTHKPIPRDELPEGVEQAAAQPVAELVGGDPARARALWGFAHGLTALELAGRFPPDADIDAAWDAGIAALRSWTRTNRTTNRRTTNGGNR